MAPPNDNAPTGGRHLILYDGVCGLCNRFVRFVIARDPAGLFHFAPLQDEGTIAFLARHGADATQRNTSYVAIDWGTPNERLLDRSRCALFVLAKLGGPWKIVAAARLLPTFFLDAIYNGIARHRHRLFKVQDACAIASPTERARFRTLPAGDAPG